MNIKVAAFGIAKDIIGSSSIEIQLADGTIKVADLKKYLNNQFPALSSLKQYFIAIDESYATEEQLILGHEEIVIIPPVSGG